MNGWTGACMDGWVAGRMHGWTGAGMYGWSVGIRSNNNRVKVVEGEWEGKN